MICLLVITDGRRDCIEQTIPSALRMLTGPITSRVIYDDSGDPDHRAWLKQRFPNFELIYHHEGRQGFGGAIRHAWGDISYRPEPFVFHLEDDFTFNRPVTLADMMRVLDFNPHLIQLALRRQPWNDHERLAGGIVEQHPDDYEERWLGRHAWLEHRLFFTTNPSLYPKSLCLDGWPEGSESEGHFSHQILRENPSARFAFWGARDSGEWVTHIGHQRVGTGY